MMEGRVPLPPSMAVFTWSSHVGVVQILTATFMSGYFALKLVDELLHGLVLAPRRRWGMSTVLMLAPDAEPEAEGSSSRELRVLVEADLAAAGSMRYPLRSKYQRPSMKERREMAILHIKFCLT